MPIIIPWVMLIASAYLVIAPIIDKPEWEYLYATMFIVAGLIFYIPFVQYKLTIKFMGKLLQTQKSYSESRANEFIVYVKSLQIFQFQSQSSYKSCSWLLLQKLWRRKDASYKQNNMNTVQVWGETIQ